ncbi:MAG: 3-deoxy-7-phosphoheptulonate synthase class II [Micrococcales bacterium]|nr:3-deoxy-7-phosphoheptulonate synthase class II [Micrococcales bacterium]MCL2668690.1 3-deoxy-7-phosphoheptulonate synthase class II [Micrococcales bacterium]
MGPEAELLAALDAWQHQDVAYQPPWPDAAHLGAVRSRLATLPPLVFAGEADALRTQLAKAGAGEAFVLQGGDCAESFAEATADKIRNKIKLLLQMAVVLTYGASMPVVKLGRMAGQYAKPRSSQTETRDQVTLPSFYGDAVNSHEFDAASRVPDPERLLDSYHTAASTLNLIRAFTTGGFASLRQAHEWNRGFTQNPAYARYEEIAAEIDRAMRFMTACGVDVESLRAVDLFASHEGLLLDYERALTRIDSRTGLAYDCSAHFVWIGERTRDPDGAHVEYFAQVRNPLGVKIGPSATPDDVVRLVDRLNPAGEAGRLTFIARMGAGKVRDALGPLVAKTAADGRPVTWTCDPMHGNTITVNGYKTRRFTDVVDEVAGFFEVHRGLGTVPGGLHVELTGDDVTEVLGGAEEIDADGLARRYETLVDPRLNHQQGLELAFQVVELLRA